MKAFKLEEATIHTDQIRDLELQRVSFSQLEKRLPNFSALRRLSIRKSRLQQLPHVLFNCSKLTTLILDDNYFRELPEAIGQLPHLHTLSISKNQLQYLPNALRTCITLRQLQVSGNLLEQWPDILARLPWLSTLDLSYNRISSLPGVLPDFPTLRRLDLSGNGLSSLPEKVHFPGLETLILRNNHLEIIPATWLVSPNLKHLDISGNPVKTLPELPRSLKSLNIAHCLTETFPEALFQLEPPIVAPHLSAQLQRQLNTFLKACRKMDISTVNRKALFQAYCEEETVLERFSRQELAQFLAIPLVNLQQLLISRLVTEGQFPESGMKVALLGKAEGYPGDWRAKIAKAAGINWAPISEAEWLVIGKSPYPLHLISAPETRFASLSAWWNKVFFESKQSAWTEARIAQLRRLLLSPDSGNFSLAVRLMQADGLPPILRDEGMFAWWTAVEPQAKKAIREQLARVLDPESCKILQLPWHARRRNSKDFIPWMCEKLENTPFNATVLRALLENDKSV
jgi:Leucine-rich repeat (LRR) protein